MQIATGTTCNTSIGVPPYYQDRFQELRALRLIPPAVGRDLFFLTATPGVLVARGGFSKKVVLAFVTCQGGYTHAAPRGPMHVPQDAHALIAPSHTMRLSAWQTTSSKPSVWELSDPCVAPSLPVLSTLINWLHPFEHTRCLQGSPSPLGTHTCKEEKNTLTRTMTKLHTRVRWSRAKAVEVPMSVHSFQCDASMRSQRA